MEVIAQNRSLTLWPSTVWAKVQRALRYKDQNYEVGARLQAHAVTDQVDLQVTANLDDSTWVKLQAVTSPGTWYFWKCESSPLPKQKTSVASKSRTITHRYFLPFTYSIHNFLSWTVIEAMGKAGITLGSTKLTIVAEEPTTRPDSNPISTTGCQQQQQYQQRHRCEYDRQRKIDNIPGGCMEWWRSCTTTTWTEMHSITISGCLQSTTISFCHYNARCRGGSCRTRVSGQRTIVCNDSTYWIYRCHVARRQLDRSFGSTSFCERRRSQQQQ